MNKILPSVLLFAGLILISILIDLVLHSAGIAWIGRYFGILGTSLIIISFIYSLKKRKLITAGQPKSLLATHETLGWTGGVMIIVHGGIHFNAVIPWMALFAMVVVIASGLTGKYLLTEVKNDLKERVAELKGRGFTPEEIERDILFQSLLVGKMQKWRKVHMPLNAIFMALALIHIIGTLLMWSWR
ncbi:MAG: hypothetical protein HBSAPP04_21610 [Ignavibacteriaceae bacterium]|nr:MAG: hypothetical protein HBSAPP04_21610 [Ignavibacteriaceae bacterium]